MSCLLPETTNSIDSPTYALFLKKKADRCKALEVQLASLLKDKTQCSLEIGCGHGHWLVEYTAAHPEQFCLGIDLISKRLAKAEQKRAKRKLDNVAFCKAEAHECLQCLPNWIQLEAIFVLFPDPWPKTKHHKNRLIQTAFLSELAGRTTGQSKLYFRTDHKAYFEWTYQLLSQHSHWSMDRQAKWPFEHPSYFQKMMGHYHSLIGICRK